MQFNYFYLKKKEDRNNVIFISGVLFILNNKKNY